LSICANSSGISSTRSVLVMCIGVSMAANINILPQFYEPRKNLANGESQSKLMKDSEVTKGFYNQ